MKILYVPLPIRNRIEQAGGKPSQYLQLKELSTILSSYDLAYYIKANTPGQSNPVALLAPIVESFAYHDLSLQLSVLDQQEREGLQKALERTGPPSEEQPGVLRTDLLDENTIRITKFDLPVDPDGVLGNPEQDQSAFYDRLIQQIYGYYPFHELAKLPIFNSYLSATLKQELPSPN